MQSGGITLRSFIFWIVFLLGYAAFIGWNVYKLRDIARNPEKYEAVKGRDRYKKSFWYESGYKRYGKNSHATLLLGISCMFMLLGLYVVIGNLIQRFWLIPATALRLSSGSLWVGANGTLFFSIAIEQFIFFSMNSPVFVAARLYCSSGKPYVKAWRNTILLLLIMGIICLPVMAIGINAYSYADEEKIVTHGIFALREKEIPYTSVVSGETAIVYVEDEDAYSFQYRIILADGTELDIIDYGIKGAAYIDSRLQHFGVAVQYGNMDVDTYEHIKETCDSATVEFMEQCFTIKTE